LIEFATQGLSGRDASGEHVVASATQCQLNQHCIVLGILDLQET
jgi:hypothetical protein